MDLTGTIKDVQIDYKTRKPQITLLLNEEPNGIENMFTKLLRITIKIFKEKRSLNSNKYFHVLCDKLRQKNKVSMARQKNELIAMYGQIQYLPNGEIFTIKTNADEKTVLEMNEPHMEFIKIDDQYDDVYWYRVYRGSHTYDSAEMAQLIEGTVMECKDAGIETATPEEQAKMLRLWEEQRKDSND